MAKRKITYAKSEYPNSFKRQGAFPLDETSVKYSKDELDSYAQSTDEGAYVGQIVTVVPADAPESEAKAVEAETYVIYSEGGLVNRLVKESELLALEVNDDSYKTTDSKYVAKVTQTEGKIEVTKHEIVGDYAGVNKGTGTGLQVSTKDGVTTIKETPADGENVGVALLYDSSDCTTFTSDSGGGVTPAAVRKAVPMFESTTDIKVGESESTSNSTTDFGDPYIKIIDNQQVFGPTSSVKTSKYRAQIQLQGGSATAIKAKDGIVTISDIASYSDSAVDNKYVSEVDQSAGTISVKRRTILEDTTTDDSNSVTTQTTNGEVTVLTSMTKPATDKSAVNKGIIPKQRTLKGAKGIEVVVGRGTSDITVQHTTTVIGSDGKVDEDGKTETTQTSNNTAIENGGTFTISDVNYDAQGHVTSENTATLTLPQYKNGTGIEVKADSTTTDVTNDYKVNLQTATTDVIGGIKISKDTTRYAVTGKQSPEIEADVTSSDSYRAVEIDKNDKAFVYIPIADTATNGIAKLHKAENCHEYVSDDGGATPAAVKKASNHDTKLYVGDSASVENTEMDNPYIKIAENKYDFTDKAVKNAVTNTIQVVGGTGVSITSDTDGKITVSNSASLGSVTSDSTGTLDYIVDIAQSGGSISATKKYLYSGTGISIQTGQGDDPDGTQIFLDAAKAGSIGGIRIGKTNPDYTVYANTSNIDSTVTSSGNEGYYAVETDKQNKAFVYVQKPRVFVIRNAESSSAPEVSDGTSYINGTQFQLNKNDICIVQCRIGNSAVKRQHTAYIYNGSNWVAMDGNYDARNVYFHADIPILTNFGNYKGSTTELGSIPCQGKSLYEVLEGAFGGDDETVWGIEPSASASATVSRSIAEVGETITLTYVVSLDAGTYEHGSDKTTGIQYSKVSGSYTENDLISTGATLVTQTKTVEEGDNTYTFAAQTIYRSSVTKYPCSLKGEDISDKLDDEYKSEKTIELDSEEIKYTGYRYWYASGTATSQSDTCSSLNRTIASENELGGIDSGSTISVACRTNKTPELFTYDDFKQSWVLVSDAFSSGVNIYVMPENKRSDNGNEVIYTTDGTDADKYMYYTYKVKSSAQYKVTVS